MDAFFYKLQQQVSFHQLDTDSEGDNDEGDDLTLSSQTQDIKDDEDQLAETPGGQAAGSKASFSSHRAADFPPSYRQVSQEDELPSYMSVLSGTCTIVSGPRTYSAANVRETYPSRNQKSTLSDIPFQFHPSLDSVLKVYATYSDLDLEHQAFDCSKYSHDFRNERLCLRDMSSNEMANISEFLIAPQDHQSCARLPLIDSDADLIQL